MVIISVSGEPLTPMIPPIGLRAIVISSTTIVLTWSDNTLGRNQRITDNRFYTVRYNPKMSRKHKTINSTDLNVHIDDLKPNTDYEFGVKVIKGRRQSTWSLSAFNKTFEAGMKTDFYMYVCIFFTKSVVFFTALSLKKLY